MPIAERFTEIESPDFSAAANTSSVLSGFVATIFAEPRFNRLVKEISENPAGQQAVLIRIKALVELEFDFRYENPYDVALCAYTLAISKFSYDEAVIAAELISAARNSWWCTKVAERVFSRERTNASRTEFATLGFAAASCVGGQATTYRIVLVPQRSGTKEITRSSLLRHTKSFVLGVSAKIISSEKVSSSDTRYDTLRGPQLGMVARTTQMSHSRWRHNG